MELMKCFHSIVFYIALSTTLYFTQCHQQFEEPQKIHKELMDELVIALDDVNAFKQYIYSNEISDFINVQETVDFNKEKNKRAIALSSTLMLPTRAWYNTWGRTWALTKESIKILTSIPPYIPIHGSSIKRIEVFHSPAIRKQWFSIRADALHILFKHSSLEVEDIWSDYEYYIIVCSIILFIVWIWACIHGVYKGTYKHFDVMELVPEAVMGRFERAFEVGLKVISGYNDTAMNAATTVREKMGELARPFLNSLAFIYCTMSLFYEARPSQVIFLFVLLFLKVANRLIQAWHLSASQSKDLLCDFTRIEFIQQDINTFHQNKHDHRRSNNYNKNVNKTVMHVHNLDDIIYRDDCRFVELVSQNEYTLTLIYAGVFATIVCLVGSAHRILRMDFIEFYDDPYTFEIVYDYPLMGFIAELSLKILVFNFILHLLKAPWLCLLTTEGQYRSLRYFTHHFPFITPYAYAGRSPPEPPIEGIFRWVSSRRILLRRLCLKLQTIQRSTDAFHTFFFLILVIMGLFCTQTDFFLYNGFGLTVTTAGLVASCVALSVIYKGEKTNKVIHHDQSTLFWDTWSRTTSQKAEEKVIYHPQGTENEGQQHRVAFCGIPVAPYSTALWFTLLFWVWGYIIYQSVKCHRVLMDKH